MKTLVAGNGRRRGLTLACIATAILLLGGGAASAQRLTHRLLPRDQIARLGLTRAWFAQVELDSSQHHVVRAILSGDQLFVLTSAGTLHAIQALTGETMWVAPLGNPNWPSLGPTASKDLVAFVNGATLYVLKRANGQPAIVRRIGGATGAAPAISPTYCFVPMVTGRLEGYPMADAALPPWFYQSHGRAMTAPLVTDMSVVWTTSSGHIYVANSISPGIRYRVETDSEIVASPSYRSPIVFVATYGGEVLALHETTGAELWKFAAEYPIIHSPAAVGGRVFVTSLRPALFAVDGASGQHLWSAPKVAQFAAASHERVYAIDNLNALVVLDAASGALLNRMPTDGRSKALVNDQTDRFYLVSNDGKVQCLHEIGAVTPIYHNLPAETAPAQTAPVAPAAAEPAEPAAAPTDNPFGILPAATPAGTDDPFGGGAQPPAGGAAPGGVPANPPPGDGGNPFGDNPLGGGQR